MTLARLEWPPPPAPRSHAEPPACARPAPPPSVYHQEGGFVLPKPPAAPVPAGLPFPVVGISLFCIVFIIWLIIYLILRNMKIRGRVEQNVQG